MIDFGTSNGLLTINLKALADNYRLFQSKVGDKCMVAGVIKANAYGLGVKEVSSTLKTLKCPQYFVATLDEAIELRALDSKTPIAVLGGLMKGVENAYIEQNIQPTLNSFDDIDRWNRTGQSSDAPLPAIIHFDTAMNRLGLSEEETQKLIETINDYRSINVQLIMSHFACADIKDHPLTDKQIERFDKLSQAFPNAKKALGNSSGTLRKDTNHYDMVRPGYGLYGGNPLPEDKNPMKDVVSLHVPILQTRTCNKGESIGYAASHVFDNTTRTATIAMGYADDFFRILSNNKGTVYFNGQACPVLGRVSMDSTSIDISHIAGRQPEQGDAIEILGPNQTIDDLAEQAGTIGYEVLTSLGHRYKRHYISL